MKFAGLLMILTSCTVLGLAAGESLSLRYKSMKQVSEMLQLLQGEIRCSYSTFSRAFLGIAARMPEPWPLFLEAMAEKLDSLSGGCFREIWEEAVSGLPESCGLTPEDRRSLKELGSGLGYLDAQMQMQTLSLFLEHWKLQMEELRQEMQLKQRVYRCLGVSGGLALMLVLL